jgi:hypothetical protein
MGAHVPWLGEAALQAACGQFDSVRLHMEKRSILRFSSFI